MTDTLQSLESRLSELDRMMANLRETICTETFALETMKQQRRDLTERIAAMKQQPEYQHE